MTTKNTPPSRRELHRKALMAAGSVVLALGIGGCAGASAYEVDDDGFFSGRAADDTALSSADDTGSDCDGGDDVPDCLGIDDGEEWAACCSELAEWCAEEHPHNDDAMMACTYGEDFDGSTGCIPWGPPVPPRFRGALV